MALEVATPFPLCLPSLLSLSDWMLAVPVLFLVSKKY